jgi:hypothetical protein
VGRKILFGFCIAIVGLIAILFTAGLLNIAGNWLFAKVPFLANLSDKGSLGDAMNGLTAPVITLASAILIYFTFKEQNKANQNQLDANREFSEQAIIDTYTNTFSEIKGEFESLTLKTTANFSNNITEVIEHRGIAALGKFVKGFKSIYKEKEGHPFMKNLSYICQELTSLMKFIKANFLFLKNNTFY